MKNLYKGRHSLTVLELTALPDEPEAMDILSIAERFENCVDFRMSSPKLFRIKIFGNDSYQNPFLLS